MNKPKLSTCLLTIVLGILSIFDLQAQTPSWVLQSESGSTKVYTKANNDTGIKEVRITSVVNAEVNEVLSFLGDVTNYRRWVYKCSKAEKLKVISNHEFYYRTVTDFPFPASDRDLVMYSRQWIDSDSGIAHSQSVAKPDFDKESPGIVRVREFETNWKLIPRSKNVTIIEYQGKMDPGGNIPTWIVNMGITNGPMKTMAGLTRYLEMSDHQRITQLGK